PIYDESIAVGPRYLLFRAYNFTIAAGVLLLLRAGVDDALSMRWRWLAADGPRRLRSAAALILLLGGAAIGLSGAHWGFTADRESITEVLAATRETEHFVIH
ncbi:MAG: hypothetical protein KC431_27975, partial [Myxococcales bacterium]|nr:hypothetical protein [Myxococcales bacterium]